MQVLDPSRFKDLRVAVTGGTGFIGAHLLSRLRELRCLQIFALTRQPNFRVEGITPVDADLSNLRGFRWPIDDTHPIDVLFHLGAYTPKDQASGNLMDPIYQTNVEGTFHLLAGFSVPPKKIIFASTIDVYPCAEAISEENPTDPPTFHGASKLFGEELIRNYARSHGTSFVILRYGHIFGPGEEAYAKLIPHAIRCFLRGESPIIAGSGRTLRDYLYVADAVEATLRSSMLPESEVGPLNIVSGQPVTISELVEMIKHLLNSSVPINYQVSSPEGKSISFSSAKLKSVLGEWPLVSLSEGLTKEIAYFRNLMSSHG